MNFKNVFIQPNLNFRHLCEEVPDQADFRMHLHDRFELLYFIKGHVNFVIETTVYELHPHSLVITRPMESHQLKILSEKPYERYTMHFPQELIDIVDPTQKLTVPFLDRPLGINNVFHASEFSISPIDFFTAMEAPYANDAERFTNITVNLYALLAQLYEAYAHKRQNPFENEQSPVYEIVKYINQHLFEPLSIKSIAATFYLNDSQLSRIFKKAAGIPLWDYIVSKRLISARKLIRTGTPATSAYYQCGFKDYSSFYRLYIKKFKTSPKEDYVKKEFLFTDEY